MSEIRYHFEPDPTEGKPIEAKYSGSQCLTECKHIELTKVGSCRCVECEHYVGVSGVAIKVGNGRCGGVSHTRKVWCKKEV